MDIHTETQHTFFGFFVKGLRYLPFSNETCEFKHNKWLTLTGLESPAKPHIVNKEDMKILPTTVIA